MRGINENTVIPDTFCSGLGAIEKLEGGNLRFYFYVFQEDERGVREKVLVAKLVTSVSSVPDAVMQTIAAIGGKTSRMIPFVCDLLH